MKDRRVFKIGFVELKPLRATRLNIITEPELSAMVLAIVRQQIG